MSLKEFKRATAALAAQAFALDQDDGAQRRAYQRVMEAAAAVAKIRLPKDDQPQLPLVADKAKGKGA